jgi:hypothetical protein
MVDQEATKKLHKAGISWYIIVNKSENGYSLSDSRLMYQSSTPIRKTVEECIQDWKRGERPKERSLNDISEGN